MFKTKEEFKNLITNRIEETYGRSFAKSHVTERYLILGQIIREAAGKNWADTKEKIRNNHTKQMYYFSAEFLLGRLLTSNLLNLGVYDIVKEGLADLGQDINELENLEADAGLGNGGLGRLAACFIDSLASLNYAGHGNSLRYEYGLFKQRIVNNKQVEVPDNWLSLGYPWEIRKPKHAVTINLYGTLDMTFDDKMRAKVSLKNPFTFKAVPYDIPIIGSDTKTTNTLRLWRAEPADTLDNLNDFEEYITRVNRINHNLYPDDTTTSGKYLRLTQQYMFSAAGLNCILKEHLRVYNTLDNLAEKVCIQLNDTHPVLAIPELMRLLMDDYGYTWDKAWEITTHVFNYTNHTVLQEALERWDIKIVNKLLPRVYSIIDEINKRFVYELHFKYHRDNVKDYLLIKDGQVHMANLAIIASNHINGVAKLHTKILETDVMKQYFDLFPEKFTNKTNGITHRRWLLNCNPELSKLLKSKIGESFVKSPLTLNNFLDFQDDENTLLELKRVKHQNKLRLATFVKENLKIDIDVNSIFDIQAKRFHAYKRQMLNVLHIIYLYNRMKSDANFRIYPTTFIFSGKAAESYHFAKKNIELINVLANLINNDQAISKYLKVVFIPNYSVSIAEILIPACDVSEQISLAGKEASGTGNMKFMMNGALTLGTLDGANVEIAELVGKDNIEIFGLNAKAALDLKTHQNYNAKEYYMSDMYLKHAVDRLIDGTLVNENENFSDIYEELVFKNDEYLVFADFDAYRKAQKNIQNKYQNTNQWYKSTLINIARSGKFSSDRTIEEYAKEIWELPKIEVNNDK